MAFINEIIPEEQKDKFNFPVQVLYNWMKPTLYKWVIDSENGCYLVMTSTEGGGYDGVKERNTFYFHVDNEDVYIKATPCGRDATEDNRRIFRWEINELVIPGHLKDTAESIVELIVQAFKMWGRRNNGASYDEVEVELLCDVDVQVDKGGK